MNGWRKQWLLAAAVALWLVGCLPIPDVRLELDLPQPTYRLELERVATRYDGVDGYPEPNTPAELNRSFYLRYFVEGDTPRTVLVLVPGLFGGAMSFDILARQLVAATPGLEVWAVDRRSNQLEDRSAIVESLRLRDPTIAHRYYIEHYGRDDGFTPLSPEDVPFMGHWGLRVHLEDLHAIVLRAKAHADAVVLGGHSLGASLVSLYAAFNLGETERPRAGESLLDGLVLLDGTLGRTGGFDRNVFALGPIRVLPTVADLEAGLGTPYLTFPRGPVYFREAEVVALLARFRPDDLSPGGFVDYPATNRAVVGILADARHTPTPIFGVTLGEPVGARFAGNVVAVILSGREGVTSRSVTGVAPGFDYVDWRRGDPPALTDIDHLARAFSGPYSNFGEWYFPVRLLLDISELSVALSDKADFVPHATVTVPTLAVGAERGLVASLDGFSAYMNARPGAPFSSYILPRMTHLDIVTAEANPLVPLLKAWLRQLGH
jgi:pimeloyl-ACP methyl ester carboxylesterase